jgi:hypothetical protein
MEEMSTVNSGFCVFILEIRRLSKSKYLEGFDSRQT